MAFKDELKLHFDARIAVVNVVTSEEARVLQELTELANASGWPEGEGLYTWDVAIWSQLGILPGLKAFVAAVLGGIGNLRGALLGGLLLGVMENYGQAVFGTQWRDVVAFVLLVLVLLVRPTGILGESLGKARV